MPDLEPFLSPQTVSPSGEVTEAYKTLSPSSTHIEQIRVSEEGRTEKYLTFLVCKPLPSCGLGGRRSSFRGRFHIFFFLFL